jgi:hypothetical protein
VGRVGGVGRVGRVGGVGGVGLILGGLASACGKTGADSGSPSGPSPAPVVPSRVVELTVDEGIPSMGIRLTTDGPPFVAYSACRGLQNVSGMTITFTYEMEVLGENGEVYPTFSFAAPATMLGHLQGFSGCGTPRTYDFDLSHQTARSYRMRVRYQTESGITGVAEGSGAMRAMSQPLPPRLVVNEFRSRGPNGPDDEFVELYNDSASGSTQSFNLFIRTSADVAQSAGFDFPRIGSRCHFLIAGSRYSGAVRPDAMLPRALDDDGTIALLLVFSEFTQNDIVGMNGLGLSGYNYEGTPLAPFGAANSDRSYVRVGRDTNDNAIDFTMRGPSTPQNSNDCGTR